MDSRAPVQLAKPAHRASQQPNRNLWVTVLSNHHILKLSCRVGARKKTKTHLDQSEETLKKDLASWRSIIFICSLQFSTTASRVTCQERAVLQQHPAKHAESVRSVRGGGGGKEKFLIFFKVNIVETFCCRETIRFLPPKLVFQQPDRKRTTWRGAARPTARYLHRCLY